MEVNNIDELCINTIRLLAVDMVEKAKSGHPGMPMGMAAIAYTIWTKFMRHNPVNPEWPNRDRFVLSAGHGSALLYSLLHLSGYDLPMDELKRFRQWGSKTPGHPEYGDTPGVEVTTGPLGQGFAHGVGMAIAEKHLAAHFNRPGHDVVDHYIYAICSDGDLMEGVASEAASIAGHLKLGNLIYFYADNKITIEGSTDLTFTEDVAMRFEAYGWHVIDIDAYDLTAIGSAIKEGQKETNRPTLIISRSHIGYGSPNKQDTAEVHGAPLGEDEVRLVKRNFGFPEDETFFIPEEAKQQFAGVVEKGQELETEWRSLFDKYAKEHPELAREFKDALAGKLPDGWEESVPEFPAGEKLATRQSSGKTLNAIASSLPLFLGGSADLAPSTNTYLNGCGDFEPDSYGGRNFHFGIREHAMGAIVNGMALSGMLIPFGATFFVFTDYMKPAIRLAALMDIPSLFVFTHDSIGLGEDGPTHQPVEHLAALRSIPNLTVYRPAEANETAQSWRSMISRRKPAAIVLTRQGLPTLDMAGYPVKEGVSKGAYILSEAPSDLKLILIATGSEVTLAMEAKEKLNAEGISTRIVSMPSWELFSEQSQEYRDKVLPPNVKARLAIETGSSFGWERWVGDAGSVIGIDKFGASAPLATVMKEYGFSVENIISRAKNLLKEEK
jgi:transketolase